MQVPRLGKRLQRALHVRRVEQGDRPGHRQDGAILRPRQDDGQARRHVGIHAEVPEIDAALPEPVAHQAAEDIRADP